jgi:hypothetical protein
MAIDYIVGLECTPKRLLSTAGILQRLKGRERAQTIIRLFREHGDGRPPSQMGFEFVRNTPEGEEETQIIVVQDLLDEAESLTPHEANCVGCRANVPATPFGCIGSIQYPLSTAAERWMIDRLPGVEEPLLWLLLRQGIQELGYDGAPVVALRQNGVYFEDPAPLVRDLQDFTISSDQLFEMTFLLGDIQPAHAGLLLQFFHAVPRATETPQIVQIMNRSLSEQEILERYPFTLIQHADDDRTISEIKRFLGALHRAWLLNVPLQLDV